MINRHTLKDLTWLDLDSPTPDEVREVMDEYSIHPLIAEDMLAPSARPRLDVYENSIYLILHFPALKHTHSLNTNQEVDFVIGKNFLITTHYDTIDPLHKFSKVFEVRSILENDTGTAPSRAASLEAEHAGFLFYALIRKLYRAVIHELEFSSDALHEIEDRIFRGKERQMVVELSKISRDLLDVKTALGPHRDILEQCRDASVEFFGHTFAHHARAMLHELERVRAILENAIAVLGELRETNNSLVWTRQNEVMKVLTTMASMTFPLTLIAGIFGMNTTVLPFAGNPYDFWIVMGVMATATVILFSFFKYKQWL